MKIWKKKKKRNRQIWNSENFLSSGIVFLSVTVSHLCPRASACTRAHTRARARAQHLLITNPILVKRKCLIKDAIWQLSVKILCEWEHCARSSHLCAQYLTVTSPILRNESVKVLNLYYSHCKCSTYEMPVHCKSSACEMPVKCPYNATAVPAQYQWNASPVPE